MTLNEVIRDALGASRDGAPEAIVEAVVNATSEMGLDPSEALDVLTSLEDSASSWAAALRDDVRMAEDEEDDK